METNYILALLFLIVAWVFAWRFGTKVLLIENQNVKESVTISGIMLIVLYGAFTMTLSWNDYRDGQIDALKGKFKYRMEINYDQHGTPKDTIYVKDNYTVEPQGKEVVVVPVRPEIDTVIYINN